jgi:eight-cysteine-cluster-containing protein
MSFVKTITFILFLAVLVIVIYFSAPKNNTNLPPDDFCGWSTYGSCLSDSDCQKGGCSGQVCQSESEEPVITTCEFRECYNAELYEVYCKCSEDACQWLR